MDLLDYIIKYMNNKVQVASNLFDNIYGLCELTGNGNDKAFMHYVGNGQGKPVTDFDKGNGTMFWVKRGAVSITPDAPVQLQDASCSAYVTINYPLRAIGVVKKSHLPCDNATAVDQAAQELLHKLGGKDKTLRAALSASFCTINPTSYTTEVSGLPKNYEYASFALDYTVQVVLKQSCIPALCEDVPLPSCDFSVALRNTEGLLVYTVNQNSANPFTLAVQPIVDGNGNTVNVPYDPSTPYVTTACTVTCEAATAVLKDTDGNTLSTTSIPSGDTQDITAPDGDVTVNGAAFGSVLSGGAIDVPVEYENGTPVGTITAGVVVIPNPTSCPDATAYLKDTDGVAISTTPIASGGSANITAPDGTVNVENSQSVIVAGGLVKSNGSLLLSVTDSTAVLKDTAGNILSSTDIPAEQSADITAPDGDITVNSVAFDTVLSGGTQNVVVRQEVGSTQVGSKQGSFWRIADSDININSAAFSSVAAEDTLNVVVKDTTGAAVGSKVGSEWIVPALVQDTFINVLFDTGATLDYTITIDSNTAGTYTSAAFSGGMASATYEVNGTPDTLPFTLVATDTLRIIPNAVGTIKLSGTY